MSKCLKSISALLCMLAMSACGNGPASDEEPRRWDDIVKVLSTAPSDALCLSYFADCSEASALRDSSGTFFGLGLEKLRTGMVISDCYNGSNVQVLTVAPIANAWLADSASALNMALASAKARRLQVEFVADAPSLEEGEGVLVLTPSASQMRAALRHIEEGRSILEVEGFRQAALAGGGADEMIVLRNSGARRLTGADLVGGAFSSNRLNSFIGNAALWTTIVPDRDGGRTIVPESADIGISYTQMLSTLPFSQSRLGEMLPPGTQFALTLMLSPEFRGAYESYLDAGVRLTAYHRRLKKLEEDTGKAPLDWEKETAPGEIALVVDEGHKVVMLRHGRKIADSPCSDNPYRGFAAALYGSAFELEDDSSIAFYKGWQFIGKRDDIEALLLKLAFATEEDKNPEWLNKPCRFVIFNSGEYLSWDKNGIKTWKSNQ